MRVSYLGEYLGLPKEEFKIKIPGLKEIKEIWLFGTYDNDILISKGWKRKIAKNVINSRVFEIQTDEDREDTIVLGLPFEFREKWIGGDKQKLAQALKCLFKRK